jgi:cysteine synthase A
VTRDQERFSGKIGPAFQSLHAAPSNTAHPFAIVVAEEVVGFFLLRERGALPPWAPSDVVTLHNFRIASRFQRRGYGREGIRLAACWISQNRPHVERLMLAVNSRNAEAGALYCRCGFLDTGALHIGPAGDQHIMSGPIKDLCRDARRSDP